MTRQTLRTKCAPPQRLGVDAVGLEQKSIAEHICASCFDFFPLSVLVINSCRQIVFGNKAFLDVLGIKELGDFLGERPGEAMDCIYASVEEAGCGTSQYCRECGALKAILDSMLNNSKSKQDCQLLVKEHGETRARDLRVFVSPWKVDEKMYYVMSLVDIAEEKRREALERIFFHDILNAAGGAKGLVDILVDEVPDEAKELVVLTQASLFGLVEEITKQKQLLALEKNEYTISRITLQGAELIQKVANEYRTHPAAVGKHIVIAPDSVNLSIASDYSLLMRVLVNMTLNALEATSEGGSVTLGLDEDGDFARFWAANRKVMPEAVKVQIFKRSFSTKGAGRGLGTYSIKLLTENYLDGKVGFTSEEPDGTRFWVKIKKSSA